MAARPARAFSAAVSLVWLVGLAFVAAGCGQASHGPSFSATGDAATSGGEASAPDDSGGASGDTAAAQAADGTPQRTAACTPLSQQTGTALNTPFGRLDGVLVYVVEKDGSHACNGDDSHVHLQVKANGAIYDVAVDIGTTGDEVSSFEEPIALPGGAWAEGWHGTDTLTYTALGIHSGQFTAASPDALSASLDAELAQVNHVSIFGTAYDTDNGCHDVHYHGGNGGDGALFLDPLSPTAHGLFFRFPTDTF